MRRVTTCLLIFGLLLAFTGCSSDQPTTDSTVDPIEEADRLLQGTWQYNDGYAILEFNFDQGNISNSITSIEYGITLPVNEGT